MNHKDIPINEYINGESFEASCDVDIEKNPCWHKDILAIKSPVVSVFCQTHELIKKIHEIKSISEKKIVLVTHNSDGGVHYWDTGRECDFMWKNEQNITHWFCQNCDIDEPNVTPIPIALENSYVFSRDIKMKYMRDIVEQNIPKQDRLFLCFSPGTNPQQRESAYSYFQQFSWASLMHGFNNINLYKPFFDEMARCSFVLCPDGHGLDTVRLWESLYLGCIPIVKRHPFTEYFAKYLPIIVVDYWSDVTIEKLLQFKEGSKANKYSYNMLTGSYWKNEIIKAKNKVCA